MSSRSIQLATLLSAATLACGGGGDTSAAGARRGTAAALTGAGATSPTHLPWFDACAQRTSASADHRLGGGIRQIHRGTVDFGASDGAMTDNQIAAVRATCSTSTVLGAVVVTYNLPTVGKTALRFDGSTVADIFLGRVTRWTTRGSPLNVGVTLPAADIIVVHRSDGSGTSFIFTDYLSKVSEQWKSKVGSATSVQWPTGLGGKGNEGVTQQVKQSEGSIGYVELIYAISNGLPYASIRNAAGEFTEASLKSVTAAAAVADLGPDTDFGLHHRREGRRVYPSRPSPVLIPIQPRPGEGRRDPVHCLDASARGAADGGRPPLRPARCGDQLVQKAGDQPAGRASVAAACCVTCPLQS
jgi:phosphate transport system substrate-binding protein